MMTASIYSWKFSRKLNTSEGPNNSNLSSRTVLATRRKLSKTFLYMSTYLIRIKLSATYYIYNKHKQFKNPASKLAPSPWPGGSKLSGTPISKELA